MKKSIAFAFLFLLFTSLGFSQSSKIAHVNTADILANLPEIKAAQEKINVLEQKHQGELQKLIQQFQEKAQECEKTSPVKKNSCSKEMNDLQQRAQNYQRTAAESLEKEQGNILSPIYDKVEKTISEAAQNKNLEYVLDSSPGKGVLMAKGIDLTQEIKSKLTK
ncbi:OmpH family outer membrane protein [Bacteroidetes bacterium endosymbiont of Geopemphigus sp.]|uniref:OmpH family outer membrane protein n=1 Tax=Bacteroidetes bacterium endosymbiont of Geopemphigus sp. TaxID=2047937 RepID=UPI000CD224DB|nr:OmpH family outer membrane protein [Bacteroidetes bacterium endosymbiont of Geopemphigus sp.]